MNSQSKPKINLSGSKAWITFITIGILILGFTFLWILSTYHQVSFKYDSDRGSITLIKPNTNDSPIDVKSGEPLSLREGDYIIQRKGENIIENEQTITVSEDQTFDINLYYTDKYLSQLYDFEKIDIESALYDTYPDALKLYDIEDDRLYLDGDIYGASLVHVDDDDQNRDTLKVLMQKIDGEWKLLTTPPTPVLSQPLFPEIPLDIITQINRA